jgi:hypothetical protein
MWHDGGMAVNEDKPALPKLTERALAEQEARRAREAAALRANLKRRRAQTQARKPADEADKAK